MLMLTSGRPRKQMQVCENFTGAGLLLKDAGYVSLSDLLPQVKSHLMPLMKPDASWITEKVN